MSPPYSNIKMLIDIIGINVMLNEDLSKLSIKYSIIKCSKYRYDKLIPTRWSFIFIQLILSFIYLFYSLIISNIILNENINKIKEILKIIHIKPFINYLSFIIIYFLIISFLTSSITSKVFKLN